MNGFTSPYKVFLYPCFGYRVTRHKMIVGLSLEDCLKLANRVIDKSKMGKRSPWGSVIIIKSLPGDLPADILFHFTIKN